MRKPTNPAPKDLVDAQESGHMRHNHCDQPNLTIALLKNTARFPPGVGPEKRPYQHNQNDPAKQIVQMNESSIHIDLIWCDGNLLESRR
jgi:hypothetical protein